MSDCKRCAANRDLDDNVGLIETCDECSRIVFFHFSLWFTRGLMAVCVAVGVLLGVWIGLQLHR